MPITNGCNHVAIITSDLDRFISFYTQVFEADTTMFLDEDGLRHALVDVGGGCWLHPFELPGPSEHASASSEMFQRGHIDHLALAVPDEATLQLVRRRLVEVGASDGTLTDFGPVRTVDFRDPDGMSCEVARRAEGEPRTFEDRRVESMA